MQVDRIGKRIAAMAAELADLVTEPLQALSTAERCALAAQWENLMRSQAAVTHRLVAALAQAPPAELGESSVAAALATLLRISKPEAHRRIREAADLAPRTTLTGQVVEPLLASTAGAQARGQIGGEQVGIIRRFFDQLPSFVTYDVRAAAETQLADIACGLKPEELRVTAQRLALLLDQDGDLSDADRARRRYLNLGAQQGDGMSKISGLLTSEARAVIEAVWAKLGAPGRCNPDEQSPPCVDGQPSAEAVAGDTRCTGQRNHDALVAMGRALLASGTLGSHNGLPVTMIITTTLQDLEKATGHAVTGGGSLLPMSEVIRQAAAANHYLAVRQPHRTTALPRARPTMRLPGTTAHALRQRPRLHLSRLHRPGLSQPGPSRGDRLGQRRPNRHHR
jgi:Domain of unknown function (DUF222)